MHQSISKKRIYFYLFILLILSSTFNFNLISNFKKLNLVNKINSGIFPLKDEPGYDEIFNDGLIYEGVWNEPKKFRGQTGAQDNIIPMEDIFTGVINFYPDNQLTKYLLDLRTYRPKCIQNFFIDLNRF